MASRRPKRYCRFINCSTTDIDGLRMFRFPSDENKSKLWVSIIGNDSLKNQPAIKLYKNATICEKHFQAWCFMNETKHRLVPNAVPVLDRHSAVEKLKLLTNNDTDESITDTQVTSSQSESLNKDHSITINNDSQVTFLNQSDRLPSTSSQSIQETPVKSLAYTPRKRKLSKKLSSKKKVIRRMREKYSKLKEWSKKWNTPEMSTTVRSQLIHEGISEKAANFIARQIRLSLSRGKNKRYHEDDKLFAYNIMCRSRAAYRILQKVLVLPSETTLRNFMRSKFEKPGLNKSIISAISKQIENKSEMFKNYVLIFDEMSIKPYLTYDSRNDIVVGFEDLGESRNNFVANQLLVLMIRSLCSKKKMPIGFYFSRNAISSKSLKKVIEEALLQLQNSGINICALVCDQGANNIRLFSLLGATLAEPYFMMNGKKIFTIFDPPHLLKSLRRNLMKHDLVVNPVEKHTVSFKHVIQFYNFDKNNPRRLAPKLTDNHVYAEGLQSMKVSLASQIFSNTVAASMNVCIIANIIPSEAMHTVEFIGKINDLFDSLNGSTVMPLRGKPFHCVVSESSPHLNFWKDLVNEIENWYFTPKSQNCATEKKKKVPTKCLKGWSQTLRAISLLFDVVKNDLKYIIPKRLNQDCLENFFSRVRGSGGYRTNPTAYDVQSTFKLLCVNSWKQNIKTKNCEDDDDQFFLDLIKTRVDAASNNISDASSFTNDFAFNPDSNILYQESVEDIINNDDLFHGHEMDDIEKNVNFFLAGYIAKKCLHKLSCKDCEFQLSDAEKVFDITSLYTYFRSYFPNETSYGLTYPSKNMYEAFSSFVSISDSYFYDKLHTRSVLQELIQLLKNSEKLSFIECNTHQSALNNVILQTSAQLCLKIHLRGLNRKITKNTTNLKKLRDDINFQSSSKIM